MLGMIKTGYLRTKVQGQRARRNFGKKLRDPTSRDKAWRSACSACSVAEQIEQTEQGVLRHRKTQGIKTEWISLNLLDSDSS